MNYPFPFLGHGVASSRSLELFLVARGDTDLRSALEAQFAKPKVRVERRVAVLEARAVPARLDEKLLQIHHATPLALVVRAAKVSPSAWHTESLHDPRVWSVLESVVRATPTYVSRKLRHPVDSQLDVAQLLRDRVKHHAPAPELLAAVIQTSLRSARGDQRLVLIDQFSEQLPSLMGFDFDADAVMRFELAAMLQRSPSSIEMSDQYREALAHDHAPRGVANDDLWSKTKSLQNVLKRKQWRLLNTLDEQNAAHVETLRALKPAELLLVAKRGGYGAATRIANAATALMMRAEFAACLQLYDAAIEGTLDPGAAANPLFAVQNDNNHLGVDVKRSRRYLERCLPHGPLNPAVFLNGSFVAIELQDHTHALDLLELAKRHGQIIKRHINEPLFVPLRGNARFKKLMR